MSGKKRQQKKRQQARRQQKKRQQTRRQRTRRQQKQRGARTRRAKRLPLLVDASSIPRPERPAEPPADASLPRWSRLLTKADQDPEIVLDDPRCLKPQFVTRFFDLCDGKALEAPWAAPDYAEAALALAEKTGDRHYLNVARGVAVHAAIGGTRWDRASELLAGYRQEAFDCCTVCASDWLRRQGDLMVEARDPKISRLYLAMAADVLGDDLDDDARGRILFVRGIAYHFLKDPDRALADAGEALRLLALTTPKGYFIDAVAFVACFLEVCSERRHFEAAHAHLVAFRERLKGLDSSWREVRERLRWVVALIEAWLGRSRRARACLERTRAKHMKHAPHRYALAIAIDEALVYCLHQPEVHIRSIRGILSACKRDLKLEEELRKCLRTAAREIGRDPWVAREVLVGLRRSFTVPVPGLLTERVLAAVGGD